MIKIIAGGKKNTGEYLNLISEYQKRMRKPFEMEWEFLDEEKLARKLEKWEFTKDSFIIIADERGEIISSPEFSQKLERAFNQAREVVVIIGGAYGVSEGARKRADFVWSFSKLVFPHRLARLMMVEQIYRAQEITSGSKYHHE